ncbi:MAG TPA: homocysteine methyltransferase [Clostridiaceae bacterium]|nr:homocysteine methyltransferase [Clostridiaceae bacterium]
MDFIEEINKRVLVYDGSKGYLLQKMGLKGGECPELWNVDRKDEVKKIYTSYRDAGADVIQTNTFQGNRYQLDKYGLGNRTYELNYEGTKLAKEVMGTRGFVAASIGPVGRLFEPSGDLTFNEAYSIYKEQVMAVADGGADIINFETFTDLADMRVALIAAKETCDLPVICSMAYEENGRTMMGSDPYLVTEVLKSLGADMVGVNCSFGPEHMIGIVTEMSRAGGIFFSVKPNAGLPEIVNGEVTYRANPDNFANLSQKFITFGARLIGGCCGTTPEFIKAIKEKIGDTEVYKAVSQDRIIITSLTKVIEVEKTENLRIGHLNVNKDAELLYALKKGSMDEIIDAVMDLIGSDYDAVYLNVDSAGGGKDLLGRVLDIAQGYVKDPFILETTSPEALEYALRLYRGKAGVVINDSNKNYQEELMEVAGLYGSTILNITV